MPHQHGMVPACTYLSWWPCLSGSMSWAPCHGLSCCLVGTLNVGSTHTCVSRYEGQHMFTLKAVGTVRRAIQPLKASTDCCSNSATCSMHCLPAAGGALDHGGCQLAALSGAAIPAHLSAWACQVPACPVDWVQQKPAAAAAVAVSQHTFLAVTDNVCHHV